MNTDKKVPYVKNDNNFHKLLIVKIVKEAIIVLIVLVLLSLFIRYIVNTSKKGTYFILNPIPSVFVNQKIALENDVVNNTDWGIGYAVEYQGNRSDDVISDNQLLIFTYIDEKNVLSECPFNTNIPLKMVDNIKYCSFKGNNEDIVRTYWFEKENHVGRISVINQNTDQNGEKLDEKILDLVLRKMTLLAR